MIFKTIYNNRYTFLYKCIHIIHGLLVGIKYIPYKYRNMLFISLLIYQFGQLVFNIRYFININKIIKGNSIKHTINKLLDYIFGYFIARFIFI